MEFLHNFIIKFLSELPCYRVGNILINIFPGIVKLSGLVIRHGNKDVTLLGDADTDSGHFEYIVKENGSVCLALLRILPDRLID